MIIISGFQFRHFDLKKRLRAEISNFHLQSKANFKKISFLTSEANILKYYLRNFH